jgi:coenzyme F420-reducing hydrogenase alpha subunit
LPQQFAGKPDAVVKAFNLGENIGMSAIETSRGLLIHVVRLANEKIADYRIVAPTEWNFHPAGALVEALTQAMAVLAPDEVVAKRAEAICQSLDPCVSFAVEVSHA